MPIIAFKGLLGGCFVQTCRIENKTDFIQRGCQGKIIDFAQIQFQWSVFFLFIGSLLLVKQYFFIRSYIDKGSMSAGNHSRRFLAAGCADYFDVQFFRNIFFERNTDSLLCDKQFALFYCLRCAVSQHFQLIFRSADQRSQGYSYRKSDHICAGDTDSHCIL